MIGSGFSEVVGWNKMSLFKVFNIDLFWTRLGWNLDMIWTRYGYDIDPI